MFILNMSVEVVGSTEEKEDHGFLETHLVGHPLLGVRVPVGEATEVPNSQP